jgi:4-amino-4-deoxy-L-arabinose transferase-like glycosyltransferase
MRRSPFASRVDHFPAWGLWPVLALALVLRLVGLGARSLWTDEGSTWTAATLDWAGLLKRCIERDASPPLYYVLTSWAVKLGDGEAQLRMVSVVASLVMVWLAYRLARLVAGRGVATFAALLAAVSPYQVMYAQEARTYALAGAFLLGGLLLFERAFVRGRRSAWIGYVLVSALGLYTQTISGLGLAAQGAVLLLIPEARRRWMSFAMAQAAVGVLYAPWLVASASHAGHLGSSHWYIDAPETVGVFKVFRAVLVSPVPLVGDMPGGLTPGLDSWLPRPLAWALIGLLVLVPLAGALDGFGRKPARAGTALLWAGWLLPIAAVFVLSFKAPLLMTRYFVFAGVPVAALLAIGAASLPGPVLRNVWGGSLVAVSLFGLWRYGTDYAKEPWREVAADIVRRAATGAAVLVPFDADPYAYYNRRTQDRVTAYEFSHPAEPFAARYTPAQIAEMAAAARARVGERGEVWVIVRSPNNPDRVAAAAAAESVATEGRVLADQRTWDAMGGPLHVSHWVRPAPAEPDTLPAAPAVIRPESAARRAR